jgi:hypothetical protein
MCAHQVYVYLISCTCQVYLKVSSWSYKVDALHSKLTRLTVFISPIMKDVYSLFQLQYSQIVGCLKGLKRLQKSQQYQKFRPSCPIKGNARLWWQYAFHCCQYSRNGDMIVTKTWQQCLDRGRDNVKYVEVYCKILNAQPGYVNLTVEERRLKEEMEMERGYEELKTLREVR